jgi:hypothetical protein
MAPGSGHWMSASRLQECFGEKNSVRFGVVELVRDAQAA